MKIDPNTPAYPADPIYQGMTIPTAVASQQLAALVGSIHEDQAITEQYSQDLAKEAVMLAKALIEQLNSEQ